MQLRVAGLGWYIDRGCGTELLRRDQLVRVVEAFGSVTIPMALHQMSGSHRPGIDRD